MQVFNDLLFLSMENGYLYSFDGTSFSLVSVFENSIKGMSSDNLLLYIYMDNTDEIKTYDGTTINTASMNNGYRQV